MLLCRVIATTDHYTEERKPGSSQADLLHLALSAADMAPDVQGSHLFLFGHLSSGGFWFLLTEVVLIRLSVPPGARYPEGSCALRSRPGGSLSTNGPGSARKTSRSFSQRILPG